MKIIDTPFERVKGEIAAFYKHDKYHFVVMNGNDLGDRMEVQWFFMPYRDSNEVVAIRTECGFDAVIPSVVDIIPSAWCAEAEFVDLYGVKIENTPEGFFMESDREGFPLRRGK